MGIFFGTDGIRGVVNSDLTFDLMCKCGNALTQLKDKPTIIIGRDTRNSGDYVVHSFASGAIMGGARIIDVGIVPTAGVAYLTKMLQCDYGIVVSASHNPPDFNGIKIFDSDGFKLSDTDEVVVEKKFVRSNVKDNGDIGSYTYSPSYINCYIDHLVSLGEKLNGLKVVIDGSNGASYSVAPKVFKMLGAKVYATNCKNNGDKINDKCGSLYPEVLKRNVLKYRADVGFAFDGDSDRIVAIDRYGNIYDGDKIVYLLSKYMSGVGNVVVGTSQTNMGIENGLNDIGVKLIRADVGDKYVLENMLKVGAKLGGEQSGHIIDLDYATTGDGVLCAVLLTNIIKKYGDMSGIFDVELYPQCNINILVNDKLRIMNNEMLNNVIYHEQEKLKNGRILVRASGTEPKIRVMVECEDETVAYAVASRLSEIIKGLNY